MRNCLLSILLIFAGISDGLSQGMRSAPEDKAVVYFVRLDQNGSQYNFSYFDSAAFIGKLGAPRYMRYVCKPRKHLFWAQSANIDCVEAELEAGGIYFIKASLKPGAKSPEVILTAINPKNRLEMYTITDMIDHKPEKYFSPGQLATDTKSKADLISKSLSEYSQAKASGKTFEKLEASMNYSNE